MPTIDVRLHDPAEKKGPLPAVGMYVVSVRTDMDRDEARAAAYAHVGLDVDGLDQTKVILATSFSGAGHTTGDLITYIDNLHLIATDPGALGIEEFDSIGERGGSDSEDRPVTMFMFSTGGKTGNPDWLACAETAHAVWPRLLTTLGLSIGGTRFDGDGGHHSLSLDKGTCPKIIRLKSGWDIDAEGNQLWLPFDEAWRRFKAHAEYLDERGGGGRTWADAKTLRKMRRHMKSFYNGYPTTLDRRIAEGDAEGSTDS